MKTTVEKLAASKVRIAFDVEPERFDEGLQIAYRKTVGRFNIPGFRRGKAPRKVIELHYGEGVFYEEAFDAIFPKIYTEALKEHDLDVVDRPGELDVSSMGAGKPLTFTVEVAVKPLAQLGQYTGLDITYISHPVTDAAVDAQIESARERLARYVSVDRPAQNGDQVKFDYAGTSEGEAFEGGTAKDQTLTLGEGRFIPGFEEQIVGMVKGQEGDILVTFPEEYHAENLAGKPATFHVLIHDIQEKELPELDDEFAKDVSSFDTFDEYRYDVRKNLEKREEDAEKDAKADAVLKAVSERMTVEIPDAMVENVIDDNMRDMEWRLTMSGLKFDDYLGYMGQTRERYREQFRERSTTVVRFRLALEAVLRELNIEATQEEIEAFYAAEAAKRGKSPEEFDEASGKPDAESAKDMVRSRKAIDFLIAGNNFTADVHDHAQEDCGHDHGDDDLGDDLGDEHNDQDDE